MNRNTEAENLFKKLDVELLENIDAQYFLEPRDFRYYLYTDSSNT